MSILKQNFSQIFDPKHKSKMIPEVHDQTYDVHSAKQGYQKVLLAVTLIPSFDMQIFTPPFHRSSTQMTKI